MYCLFSFPGVHRCRMNTTLIVFPFLYIDDKTSRYLILSFLQTQITANIASSHICRKYPARSPSFRRTSFCSSCVNRANTRRAAAITAAAPGCERAALLPPEIQHDPSTDTCPYDKHNAHSLFLCSVLKGPKQPAVFSRIERTRQKSRSKLLKEDTYRQLIGSM